MDPIVNLVDVVVIEERKEVELVGFFWIPVAWRERY